jgi:hypothetical protein
VSAHAHPFVGRTAPALKPGRKREILLIDENFRLSNIISSGCRIVPFLSPPFRTPAFCPWAAQEKQAAIAYLFIVVVDVKALVRVDQDLVLLLPLPLLLLFRRD